MLGIGKVVAWLLLIIGAIRIGMGLFVASFDDPTSRAAAASRYLGSASSGEAIDQGIMVFLFGLFIGILVKIGQRLSERKE